MTLEFAPSGLKRATKTRPIWSTYQVGEMRIRNERFVVTISWFLSPPNQARIQIFKGLKKKNNHHAKFLFHILGIWILATWTHKIMWNRHVPHSLWQNHSLSCHFILCFYGVVMTIRLIFEMPTIVFPKNSLIVTFTFIMFLPPIWQTVSIPGRGFLRPWCDCISTLSISTYLFYNFFNINLCLNLYPFSIKYLNMILFILKILFLL